MLEAVYNYIYAREGEEKEIMLFLHEFLMNYNLQPKIRYGLPMYYQRSWVCYMNPQKKGGIELVFMRGRELSNPAGILEDRGRTQVKGIILKDHKKIPIEAIRECLDEALFLDETSSFSLPKKPKKKK